jgi:NADPH:quinone reductase
MDTRKSGLELRSLASEEGRLEVSLTEVRIPEPGADEVIVKVQATPINPSDLGLLFGPADVRAATVEDGKLVAPIPEVFVRALKARLGQALPVGNEGAGLVVKAGASPEAQALTGKTVAMIGGAMYTQFRKIRIADVMVLPEDASAADGASCFVNPLTALAFVETMRNEGHTALIHTAAASNLGQMLVKICLKDGVPLVNIVRSAEQAKILTDLGAEHVLDSTDPAFTQKLVAAVDATGATLAFDAIGGGKLGSQILAAIEAAASAKADSYSRYGSGQFKQLYIYGGLDTGPTVFNRGSLGFSWSVSGFLLTPFLQKSGPEVIARLRQRVVDELKTTFASHYSHVVSLSDVLTPAVAVACSRKATGEKYLIDPSLA